MKMVPSLCTVKSFNDLYLSILQYSEGIVFRKHNEEYERKTKDLVKEKQKLRREKEMKKIKSKIENQEDRSEFENAVREHRKLRKKAKKAKKDKKKKEKRQFRDNKDKKSTEDVTEPEEE